MTGVEAGRDKVNLICKMIRNDVLQPAKDEATNIIAEAHAEGDAIRAKANEDADDILQSLKRDLEKQKSVHDATIELSIKQGIAKLRQLILGLFSEQLSQMVTEKMEKTDVMVEIINVIVKAIEKDGIDSDIQIALGKKVNKDELLRELFSKVGKRIEEGGVVIGDFKAGASVKIIDKKITIEMTERTLQELLSHYLSDELRKRLFSL